MAISCADIECLKHRSPKALNGPKWQFLYFKPILSTIFVTIATICQNLLLCYFLINESEKKVKSNFRFFGSRRGQITYLMHVALLRRILYWHEIKGNTFTSCKIHSLVFVGQYLVSSFFLITLTFYHFMAL